MKETRKPVSSEKEVITGKSVSVYLESQLISLTGSWYWDLYTDEVFCSDVIISTPIDFSGTKGLIHPDDKEALLKIFEQGKEIREIYFRIITTFGEVKSLLGKNISIEADEEGASKIQYELVKKAEEEKEYNHLQLLKKVFFSSEKSTETGAWYYNKSNNQTWYSPQVFRIFDLPPNSLNSHLNTFNVFIHPEDREMLTEYLDMAYKNMSPIQLDYRIITPSAEKFIRQKMNWIFGPCGEMIWAGSYQDITDIKLLEAVSENYINQAKFNKLLLNLDEQNALIGHWNVNLLTRKISYSNNLYRLFGLKPKTIP